MGRSDQRERGSFDRTIDNIMAIPTIDFSPFMREEGIVINEAPTLEQLEVAKKMKEACRQHGFLHITNFGVSDALRKQAFQASSELFSLENKEQKLRRINPNDNMGYAPFQSECINRSRPPELKEAFNVRFPPAHQNDLRGCPESFKTVVEELHRQFQLVARRYALACALALDLRPSDFFSKSLQKMDLCTIRFLHYPACDFASTSEALDKPIRVGEHTDFGAYTFLMLGEHGAEGLQIKPIQGGEIGGTAGGEQGGWQNVVVPSKGAIVNMGALMARWTNDEWRATAHRVIVASTEMASRSRYSIAFFVDPDKNALVEVHDKFAEDGKEKKYKPITGSDYLLSKLQEMMGKS